MKNSLPSFAIVVAIGLLTRLNADEPPPEIAVKKVPAFSLMFPREVIIEDALSPELRDLPKLDFSKEAAESLRLDWSGAPDDVKAAMGNHDVALLQTFLKSEDPHIRWYAAHALGKVERDQPRAKSALKEFLSSRAKMPANELGLRAGAMERFMEDAVASEAVRSQEILSDHTRLWWGSILVGILGLVSLFGVSRSRRIA